QQAGLRWVKRNIANFGGDPENITIAGQSAGGGSVLAQMACTDNAGYFQKACVFSGMILFPYNPDNFFIPMTLEQAGEKGVELFEHLGVKTLEEARKLDANFIREKYSELRNQGRMFFGIVNDGKFNTGDPMEAFADGTRNRVPVFGGNTSDEFFDFIRVQSEDELISYAKDKYGADADKFLSFADAKKKTEQGYAGLCAPEIGVKAAYIAESRLPSPKSCYYYRFDPDIPGEDDPGTFHSCDLWFFFETIAKCSRPYEGRHYDIARQMCDYWVNFIKTGDPNGYDINGNRLPEWKTYTDSERNEMVFTSQGAVTQPEGDTLAAFLSEKTANELIAGRI
ncbi:MAG: carboxylesterase family protein, partial [Oscillospiraceae bacterium]|nr:carboxylesterase family protein [Oscillospiraceae bacterium]